MTSHHIHQREARRRHLLSGNFYRYSHRQFISALAGNSIRVCLWKFFVYGNSVSNVSVCQLNEADVGEYVFHIRIELTVSDGDCVRSQRLGAEVWWPGGAQSYVVTVPTADHKMYLTESSEVMCQLSLPWNTANWWSDCNKVILLPILDQ